MEKNKNIGNHGKSPLVTFFVMAYNQERFISEAVEGAFSQTYSPLEIILSDDCSSDRTFEIMQEMAATYHGPHNIILNRNEKNEGIGGHVNKIMSLAKGELIVASAGDDISLPERTNELYLAWENSNRKAFSLFSARIEIDEAGNRLRKRDEGECVIDYDYRIMLKKLIYGTAYGASHAWNRRVFDVFGNLMPIVAEDFIISLRSAYLGGVRYIPKPLILYRISSTSICQSRFKDPRKSTNDRVDVFINFLADLETIDKKAMAAPHHEHWHRYAVRRLTYFSNLLSYYEGTLRWYNALLLPIQAYWAGVNPRLVVRSIALKTLVFIRKLLLKCGLDSL